MALDTVTRTPETPSEGPARNGVSPRDALIARARAKAPLTRRPAPSDYEPSLPAGPVKLKFPEPASAPEPPSVDDDIDDNAPDAETETQRWSVLDWLKALLRLLGSPLTHRIFIANSLGWVLLTVAMLSLSQTRESLVRERLELLHSQGDTVRAFIASDATNEDPALQNEDVVSLLAQITFGDETRVRVFDATGAFVEGADTRLLHEPVVQNALQAEELGPLERLDRVWDRLWSGSGELAPSKTVSEQIREVLRAEAGIRAQTTLDNDAAANAVIAVEAQREGDDGERLLSVALPIQRVKAILGVVLLETGDVDALIAAERQRMTPVLYAAALLSFFSSMLLAFWIVNPMVRLSRAAEEVKAQGPRRAKIPVMTRRKDEIGELSSAMHQMTEGLSQRIDAIERFAADVSHELKNPLTSMRSAVEIMPLARDRRKYNQLLGIVNKDIKRMERLITDISRASRVDADLARARSHLIDMGRMSENLVSLYQAVRREDEPDVLLDAPYGLGGLRVLASEESLGHVFRNLIDNARTFCPPDKAVRVIVQRGVEARRPYAVVFVEDRGPGIPPENLERIFDRFYTSRPRGTSFGKNSGLGLAIARQIVENHGGRIWAENVKDREKRVVGARFTVALPIAKVSPRKRAQNEKRIVV